MKRFILNQDKSNWEKIINEAIIVLKNGGLIVAPSDTVYGLLVDAKNKQAVENLIRFKNRPPGKPISIFIPGFESIKDYVDLTEKNSKILKKILPGPYTVVLKSKHKLVKELESENGTLGIRLPKYEFIMDLVKRYGYPLTATSANLSGQSSIYSLDGFLKGLSQAKLKILDLVIDAGRLPLNKPSTVIDLTEDEIKVKRMGDIVPGQNAQFISKSPQATRQIAAKILKDNLNILKTKPLIIILEGELGVGKTIFVKGIGESLGVENIVSSTFVIYYEYEIEKSQIPNYKKQINPKLKYPNSKLIHIDLYNLKENEEFKHLGLENYLKPGNILCIEWGEKAGEIMDLLKEKGKVVYVRMEYINEKERKIKINI